MPISEEQKERARQLAETIKRARLRREKLSEFEGSPKGFREVPATLSEAGFERAVQAELHSRARRRELYQARKEGKAPPSRTPHTVIQHDSEAHRILGQLSTGTPQNANDLGAGTGWGMQHTSAQILRLLEIGLIERDHYGTYTITDAGEQALEQLEAGVSHTRWLT